MRPLLSATSLFIALAANAGPAHFVLHTDDLQSVRGTYLLDDGQVVHVAGTRRHPRVDFDDGRSQALVPQSRTEFLTLDGCTRLRFELNENATFARIRVTHAGECASR